MPYLHRALNTPAMLRALADVAEGHACINSDFSARADWDLLQTMDGGQSAIAVQFSSDFLVKEPEFRIALGKAYRKYGGDASLILHAPELDDLQAIERAADRQMAAHAKACGIEMEVIK
jgi:hypothetical protein